MNLAHTIIPKSDQLNADDLITGPRTIRITEVRAGSAEQPIAIHFDGDNGRPYKPGKSMRRVLIALWGAESSAYIGRALTLYRDPTIKFGSDDVGGIRISHASHIDGRQSLALTVTRGKRKPFTVEPLTVDELPAAWNDWTLEQRGENRARQGMATLQAWFSSLAVADKKRLKPTLDAEWKPLAEQADAMRNQQTA